MLFEILKNSLRAVVERHGEDCENYPPVKVIVAHGKEDITIKISDEGGGIPRRAIPLVWTYMYVSAISHSVYECVEILTAPRLQVHDGRTRERQPRL
jgi:pyruvate dehydrogenase kinase 2/3/4